MTFEEAKELLQALFSIPLAFGGGARCWREITFVVYGKPNHL
jgi:hypothetical protein